VHSVLLKLTLHHPNTLSRRLAIQLLTAGVMSAGIVPRRPGDEQSLERRVWEAINRERRREGARELAWDQALATEARRHSTRMAEAGFFSHHDPERGDLVPRLDADGIPWRDCAENIILFKQSEEDPVEVAVKAWLASPGHRKNLLNPVYTLSGVGIAAGRDNRLWMTQDFALVSATARRS
jgi:uncharacterized protein YkwD